LNNTDRVKDFKKNDSLELSLNYFHELLEPTEINQIKDIEHQNLPIIFIVGCARSGSTLLLQYLASSGAFGFPTNFLSRFYYAPYIGAKLQDLLFRNDFKNEIWPKQDASIFSSSLGKTKGPLAPHEFWYFWKRFFHYGIIQKLSSEELVKIDFSLFFKELNALLFYYQKPFIAKGMICNWNLSFLAKLDNRVKFIFIRRDTEKNAISLLNARKQFFGNENIWYSFKPPGYEKILNTSPLKQVTWQVEKTNNDILDELSAIDDSQYITINYKSLCESPLGIFDLIIKKWNISAKITDLIPTEFNYNDS